jgi:hypothetical protein
MKTIANVLWISLLGLVFNCSDGYTMQVVQKKLESSAVIAEVEPSLSANSNTNKSLAKKEKAKWTFLYFQQADCDLEMFGLLDLEEMAKVGSSDEVNFVVLSDRSSGYDNGKLLNLKNWTGGKYLYVEKGRFKELKDLGEVNMGDPETLAKFIEFAVSEYPAENYAICFWNHGGGWVGFGGDDSTPNHDMYNLEELKEGLEKGLERSNLEKFSFIGFDACLMATWEVANYMRPYTDYLIVSEELVPGHGWNYAFMDIFNSETSASVIGATILEKFQAQSRKWKKDSNITFSLLDLSKMDPLNESIKKLAEQIYLETAIYPAPIGRARQSSLSFGESPNPKYSTNTVDIGDFVKNLAFDNSSYVDIDQELNLALSKVVLKNVKGPLQKNAKGLSIYFPLEKQYYDADYDTLVLPVDWKSAVKAYYNPRKKIAENKRADFLGSDHEGEIAFEEDILFLQGKLNPESKENTTLIKGIFGFLIDDEVLVYNSSYMKDVKNHLDKEFISIHLHKNFLLLNAKSFKGDDSSLIYFTAEYNEKGHSKKVPFEYESSEFEGSKQGFVFIPVMKGEEELENMNPVFYINNENGTIGELNKNSQGDFTFFQMTLDDKGDSTLSPISRINNKKRDEILNLFELKGAKKEKDLLKIGVEDIFLRIEVRDYEGNKDYIQYIGPHERSNFE